MIVFFKKMAYFGSQWNGQSLAWPFAVKYRLIRDAMPRVSMVRVFVETRCFASQWFSGL
ncbi:MAG: hypothetical protein VSS75_033030 [Candidatus Parabeggiatoa sp.]|nr:hypothetical protein [Candidatus Parabeggiatoa sp.]